MIFPKLWRGEANGKPTFKRLVRSKRCIIPCSGFYEWQKVGNRKQPLRFLMKNGSIFSLAGLYDTWVNQDGNKLSTCTIITTEPKSLMIDIHNRMPVILRPQDEAEWLNREADKEAILKMLVLYPANEMCAYKVDPVVGNVRNNNESLLMEIK